MPLKSPIIANLSDKLHFSCTARRTVTKRPAIFSSALFFSFAIQARRIVSGDVFGMKYCRTTASNVSYSAARTVGETRTVICFSQVSGKRRGWVYKVSLSRLTSNVHDLIVQALFNRISQFASYKRMAQKTMHTSLSPSSVIRPSCNKNCSSRSRRDVFNVENNSFVRLALSTGKRTHVNNNTRNTKYACNTVLPFTFVQITARNCSSHKTQTITSMEISRSLTDVTEHLTCNLQP